MHKGRLEAFSDGVLAVIITIMVLELRLPRDATFAALGAVARELFLYLLSFVFVAIYWNNHHHMLQAVKRVNGAALWANMHLLFWLSLIPFVTGWMVERFQTVPVACYGIVLFLAGAAYYILSRILLSVHGPESLLSRAVGRDFKGIISLVIYAAAIALAFFSPPASCALYVVVALIWLAPDPRIERVLGSEDQGLEGD